jgi:hypothetical protein
MKTVADCERRNRLHLAYRCAWRTLLFATRADRSATTDLHERGLLFGMYADVGSSTCGGYSGLDMDVNLSSKQYVQVRAC